MNGNSSFRCLRQTVHFLRQKSLSIGSFSNRSFASLITPTNIRCKNTTTEKDRTSSTWTGTGSQDDFMLYDTCIVVDEDDNIIGNGTKKDCHVFKDTSPGILHRAFSVFLFDEENRLLLQKRAPQKITFPEVWTNTCCSHPLYGFEPTEVDTHQAIQEGTIPGVKTAANRKLGHELGIPSSQLKLTDFKYLTRLHYCAADERKPGNDWSWGEHEMDYILFLKKAVDLSPNPEEVCEVKYVNLEELREMMVPNNGLKWSPWFRIIQKNFLENWWSDLEETLTTEKYIDLDTIHRLNV